MSITQERKTTLIKEYATADNDTGSVEVQCAVLTERIQTLTEHLKDNHKDYSSRRGLLMLVGRRRRLLEYLKKQSLDRYVTLINKLDDQITQGDVELLYDDYSRCSFDDLHQVARKRCTQMKIMRSKLLAICLLFSIRLRQTV